MCTDRRYATLLSLIVLATSSGCARTMHEVLNRPTAEEAIEFVDRDGREHHPASAISLDASRRIVTMVDVDSSIRFCAEPPPDVATNTLSQMGLNVNADAKTAAGQDTSASIGFSDAIKTVAQVLSTRTERLDIYRTAVYSICQMYLNGAMTAADASATLREITLKALDAASSTVTPPPAAEPLPDPASPNATTPTNTAADPAPPASGSTGGSR